MLEQQLKTIIKATKKKKREKKYFSLKGERVLSFILLFQFLISLEEGGLTLILLCQVFRFNFYPHLLFQVFLWKGGGGGLSFNLLCQVIHYLLKKFKCKKKHQKQNTAFFSPLLYFLRTVSYLYCGVKFLNFSPLSLMECPSEINFR